MEESNIEVTEDGLFEKSTGGKIEGPLEIYVGFLYPPIKLIADLPEDEQQKLSSILLRLIFPWRRISANKDTK